jgi:catechol 2,3-dioxygenase-like lactoylglutathione lyase family enzyme
LSSPTETQGSPTRVGGGLLASAVAFAPSFTFILLGADRFDRLRANRQVHHTVIDCPDPALLADFYRELLGLTVTYQSPDWVVIAAAANTSGIAFQLAPDHQPPHWPDAARGRRTRSPPHPRRRVRRPGRSSVLPHSPPKLGAAGAPRPLTRWSACRSGRAWFVVPRE